MKKISVAVVLVLVVLTFAAQTLFAQERLTETNLLNELKSALMLTKPT